MSKLGLHWLNSASWMKRVSFAAPYVKRVDPNEEDIFPAKRTIGRVYMTDGEEGAMYTRGRAGGAAYFARCLPAYKRAPYIAGWEFVNEPAVIKTPSERAALCAATVEWARLCHACGLKVVVGNFSERNPPDGTIAEFAPMLEVADFLGLHCYGAPTLRDNAPGLVLRYRRLAEEIDRAGLRIPPMLLGETGVDLGIIGFGRKGWQKAPGYDWGAYRDDLSWLDGQLCADDFVVGGFIFSAGASGDWQTFNLNEKQAADLAAHLGSAPTPQPPPAPPIVADGPRAFLGAPLPIQTQKLRWYIEEAKRRMETGHYGEADTVLGDLIALAGEVERKTR